MNQKTRNKLHVYAKRVAWLFSESAPTKAAVKTLMKLINENPEIRNYTLESSREGGIWLGWWAPGKGWVLQLSWGGRGEEAGCVHTRADRYGSRDISEESLGKFAENVRFWGLSTLVLGEKHGD